MLVVRFILITPLHVLLLFEQYVGESREKVGTVLVQGCQRHHDSTKEQQCCESIANDSSSRARPVDEERSRQTRTSDITPTTLVNDFNVEADRNSGFSVGPRKKVQATASKERPFSAERGISLRQEVSTDMSLLHAWVNISHTCTFPTFQNQKHRMA